MTAVEHDDLVKACAELFPRLGAGSFEVRYSEPEHDGSPVVWIAIATFERFQAPAQVAAALSPASACFRLVEQLVDGGQCQHCKKPTGVTADFQQMPAARAVCWWQLDPELKVFRRSCA